MCVPTLRAVAVTDESVLGLRGSHVATLHTLNVRTSPESTGMDAVTTRGGGGGGPRRPPAPGPAGPPPPRGGGTSTPGARPARGGGAAQHGPTAPGAGRAPR